jgi:hypothetical protein
MPAVSLLERVTANATAPAGSRQVAEQEVQHLGDPTALLGRADLPQPSAGKPIGRLRQPVQEAAAVVGVKHGLEPSRVKAGYLNVLQGHLSPSTSQAVERDRLDRKDQRLRASGTAFCFWPPFP